MNTHVFKLPSGPEMEVTELTGKQQRLLTEQNKKTHQEKLADMLASVTVRIGSLTSVTSKFILEDMLACDIKFALTELRQFSLDFDTTFAFVHKYKDVKGIKQEVEIEEDIPEGHFPMTTVKRAETGKDGEVILVDANWTEYDQVVKEINIKLPRSGKEVRFTMQDGKGSNVGVLTPKQDRSSHTPIKMRRPVYFEESKKGSRVPVQLDLDSLHVRDIEFLRKTIKEYEGNVDTELMIDNPEANEKDLIVDVLGAIAFFFPSEAI